MGILLALTIWKRSGVATAINDYGKKMESDYVQLAKAIAKRKWVKLGIDDLVSFGCFLEGSCGI
jgi:DNA-directed RNA polymerase specialized sigma subunit